MSRPTRTTFACIAALCALSIASVARAGEDGVAPPTRATASPFGVQAVDPKALSNQRGGTDTGAASDMKLTGSVIGNSAANLTTGNNVITDGAFAGVSGVPLIVQNSGNNVLIQSATIINVQLK